MPTYIPEKRIDSKLWAEGRALACEINVAECKFILTPDLLLLRYLRFFSPPCPRPCEPPPRGLGRSCATACPRTGQGVVASRIHHKPAEWTGGCQTSSGRAKSIMYVCDGRRYNISCAYRSSSKLVHAQKYLIRTIK